MGTTGDGDATADRPLLRRRIVVRGHVQGVWFRDSTRRAAQAVGATGWVRNAPDGTVVAEVQGTAAQVEQVEAFCEAGPPRSRVAGVEVADIHAVPGEEGFQVR